MLYVQMPYLHLLQQLVFCTGFLFTHEMYYLFLNVLGHVRGFESGDNDDDCDFFLPVLFCVSCVSVAFFEIKLFETLNKKKNFSSNRYENVFVVMTAFSAYISLHFY